MVSNLDDEEGMKIPLFPLHGKLFPDKNIALRIFEPRYREMIKRVAGKKEAFGVVPILVGSDAGKTPTILPHGTLASIVDFDTLPDGLLGITIMGGRPFAVHHTWVLADGLMMGHVTPLTAAENSTIGETRSGNAGPLDHRVADGLGVPVDEYVLALLSKRVQTEFLGIGSHIDGIPLTKNRVIFRYQGRTTFIDLDE